MKRLGMLFLPTSRPGRWSALLLVASLIFFAFANLVVLLQGPMPDQTFLSNPLLSIPMACAGVAILSAFITGMIAIISRKERSVIVWLSLLIGLPVLFFVSGELFFPH